jgi:acyl carrier protein
MLDRALPSHDAETIQEDVPDLLAALFANVLRVPLDRIHPELRPSDVDQWDSIHHVMLVAAIEEEFAIQLDVEEIMEFTDYGSILSAVQRRFAA